MGVCELLTTVSAEVIPKSCSCRTPFAYHWTVQDKAWSSLILKVRTNIYRMLSMCQPGFKAHYMG